MYSNTPAISNPQELLDAFLLFTKASESLEGIHGQLLRQIEHLSQELEASNARLRDSLSQTENMRNELLHIIECQPNGVLVVEPSGNMLHANGQAYEFLGLAPASPPSNVSNLPVVQELRDFIFSCLQTPEQTQVLALSLAGHSPKARKHLSVSASPLKTREGSAMATIFVVNDNTSLMRLEEENRRKERLAAMGAMSAQLAHEIRNPLNSIGLFATLLEENEPQDSPGHKWCQQIEEAVQVLNTLVCNMLNLASPNEPVLVPLDVHYSLDSVLGFAQSLMEANGIRLRTAWSAAHRWIQGDAELLRELILNLALNAIQAMPHGGELQVRSANSSDENAGVSVEITVADTGQGIDKDLLPMLFEPGFSTRQGGHGLGLWIVKQIVDKHKGQIRVSSVLGQGSEFRIAIPAIENGTL